jgi:hypothetical protein
VCKREEQEEQEQEQEQEQTLTQWLKGGMCFSGM